MAGIGPISGSAPYSSIGPLPAGVKAPTTDQQRALYDSCKQFDRLRAPSPIAILDVRA